ncbi:MAG TPA: hypothetical protein VEB03_00185 [Candidatus Nanoarchaeia archaeon]|nr:hypothetical protein [Candidatus Nanoarchaeia archaeon]
MNDQQILVSAAEAQESRSTIPLPPFRRPLLSFHLVLGAMLVLLIALFAQPTVADPDIWWHLNFAEQIVTTHSWPQVDTYSFTAAGSKWMDHEWAAELAYLAAFRAFGIRGLYALYFLLACTIEILILYRSYKLTGDIKNSFLVAGFCVLLIVVSFGPRMLLFGWLYMLLMLIALDRFREGSMKVLCGIPPLFMLWINTHGSWLIGLVVFGIIIVAGLVRIDWGHVESELWTRNQVRALGVAFAASVALLFVNPYGYRLVTYPFDMAFHQTLNISHVEEWASVDFHTARGKVVFILLASVLSAALFSKRRWKVHEVLVVALALYSGLTYVRFLFMIAVLVSPVIAARVRFFPPYEAAKDKQWLNAVFLIVVAGIVLWRFPNDGKLQQSVDEKYPTKAIEYLRRNGIKDRVLNDYLWGGYIDRFYPAMPVFIDSRVDIFEYNGTLKDYLDLTSLKNSHAILDRHDIRYVLFNKNQPLVYHLRQLPEWRVLYEDEVAALVKREARQSESQ